MNCRETLIDEHARVKLSRAFYQVVRLFVSRLGRGFDKFSVVPTDGSERIAIGAFGNSDGYSTCREDAKSQSMSLL